jgi:hypothetical protein
MNTIKEKELTDKVSFISFIITMFSRAYKMDKKNAYLFLKKYGGIDYLFRHWWTLHTEDPYWSVKSLYHICYKNGGTK